MTFQDNPLVPSSRVNPSKKLTAFGSSSNTLCYITHLSRTTRLIHPAAEMSESLNSAIWHAPKADLTQLTSSMRVYRLEYVLSSISNMSTPLERVIHSNFVTNVTCSSCSFTWSTHWSKTWISCLLQLSFTRESTMVNGFSFPHTSSLNNTCKITTELYVVVAYPFYSPGLCLPSNTKCGHPHFLGGHSCYRITIKNNPGDRIIMTAIMTITSRSNLYLKRVAWYLAFFSDDKTEKTSMSILDLGSL